jgi:hypothetical protein
VTLRRLRLAVVVCPLVAAALTVGVPDVGAAIVNVQTGTLATSTTGNVTPTLSSASTAGTLLVAVVTNKTAANAFSAPANWVSAVVGNNACCGRAQIWYYANNPGGITSAAFTSSSGTVAGQLSEWNGVLSSSPLDQTGSGNHAAGSSFAISTTGNLTQSNDLGLAEQRHGRHEPDGNEPLGASLQRPDAEPRIRLHDRSGVGGQGLEHRELRSEPQLDRRDRDFQGRHLQRRLAWPHGAGIDQLPLVHTQRHRPDGDDDGHRQARRRDERARGLERYGHVHVVQRRQRPHPVDHGDGEHGRVAGHDRR